jgi:hypothetical protein
MSTVGSTVLELRDAWRNQWPHALALWSDYLRLSEPRWCLNAHDRHVEGLIGSFAMIRLSDHAVVIDLETIAVDGLGGFALEIMGHEIGHHVYCPAELGDQARLVARIARALADRRGEAAMVANLYADLLINDRLQRERGLDMSGVYRRLGEASGAHASTSRLWGLYLRIYELLWRLPRGSMASLELPPEMEGDALLGARLIRVYGRDWLKGAGGFSLLLYPYLDEQEANAVRSIMQSMLDTQGRESGDIPDGLAELDDDEDALAVHPAEDPALGDPAIGPAADGAEDSGDSTSPPVGREEIGGQKSARRYRGIAEYGSLLHSIGLVSDAAEVAIRYYRERALPHLVRYPARPSPRVAEPEREGVESWDMGHPLESIDWVETVTKSAHVIPGVTTLQPVFGESVGGDARPRPIDLYLGIDCSGSMPNPRHALSYPVLAGTIVALSALRAGSRVMACLSGEPGKTIATDGFVSREREVLALLTDYLGTGYSYGVARLDDMLGHLGPMARPVHVLILSDTDLFSSLEERDGKNWDTAAKALQRAGGGGTVVLNAWDGTMQQYQREIKRLDAQGWDVVRITDWEEVIEFARRFAARRYSIEEGMPR